MKYLLFGIALAATGCGSILDDLVTTPPDAVRGDPPAIYATWYAQTEACAGVGGDFGRVRWFTVPGERWWDPVWQQFAIGTWRSPHDIYVAESRVDDENVVKHEVVHDLLQGGATRDPRFSRCSSIEH